MTSSNTGPVALLRGFPYAREAPVPLQRSTHDAPVDIPAIPATVGPGEAVDWPHPIAGFIPVPDEAPEVGPERDADSTPKTSTRKRAASPAATPEGDDR